MDTRLIRQLLQLGPEHLQAELTVELEQHIVLRRGDWLPTVRSGKTTYQSDPVYTSALSLLHDEQLQIRAAFLRAWGQLTTEQQQQLLTSPPPTLLCQLQHELEQALEQVQQLLD